MASNGNSARFTLATKLINQVTSEDFGLKLAMIDITSKTSAGNKEVMPGLKERTASAEVIFETKPAGSPADFYFKDAIDAWNAGTLLAFTYSLSATAGDIKFTGSLYISDCSVKSANDDKITCSLTFAITGAVTITTV
jgi:predicted secreted protein